MRQTIRARWPGVVIALAALVGACSSGSPAATTATTAAATSAANTPAGTSSATTATATQSGGSGAAVDLTFTGTRVFTAKGTSGRCIVITSGGVTRFGFEGTGAEYPGLGISFSMAELNPNIVDIKWVIDADNSYGNSTTSQVSADHHTVTVDQDLSPFSSVGGTAPGAEHVKGTITCA